MEVEEASLEENTLDDGFTCELCGDASTVYHIVADIKAHLDKNHC